MFIKSLKLKNYRNYKNLDISFNENVNLLLGNNGQGKTNLLESLYLSSIGKSFRTNKESELLYFGEEKADVHIDYYKDGMDHTLDISLKKDLKKEISVDEVKLRKISQLLDNIYIVIFSPEDLKIVKDEPEKRRKFIDKELCQIKPSYYNNLTNYKKALSERNAYLKEINVDPKMLDVWDQSLAKYGAKLIKQREEFIKKINTASAKIHKKITNDIEELRVEYDSNIELMESETYQEVVFYKALKESFDNDLRQRTTTRGPHKDDLDLFVNDINVRSFGSQGQQRTVALSLKLAEIDIIKDETGEDAILLLDDVMSELDINRQEFLIKALEGCQLFITTTEMPDSLIKKFPNRSEFHVENGIVK